MWRSFSKACTSVLVLQQHEANYSGYKTEGLWPVVGRKGAINNQTVDRKWFGYHQNNNEVIATCCDRMMMIFLSSHPLLLATYMHTNCAQTCVQERENALQVTTLASFPDCFFLSIHPPQKIQEMHIRQRMLFHLTYE